MKKRTDFKETDWNAVIARCLASIYLDRSDLKDSTIVEKAELLARLGFSLKDSAGILGTSEQSLHQQRYMKKKKKKG